MWGFIKYWSNAQISCLLYVMKTSITGKGRIWDITNYLTQLFEAKHMITRTSHLVNSKPTMFLVNHRSWSDFAIDSAILGGPSFLSRYAVILGVPFPVLVSWMCTAIWLFHRKKGGFNREAFKDFFKYNLSIRPGSSVIVYPEGTRNKTLEPLKLKTGIYECAWSLSLPVQAIVTTNKEKCLNESTLVFTKGAELRTSVSKVIHPSEYKTMTEWFEACNKLFQDTWKDAYDPMVEAKDVQLPLPGVSSPKFEHVLPNRLLAVRVSLLAIILLCALYIKMNHLK